MTLILTLGNIASVEQPRCGLIINQASIPNDDVRSDREREEYWHLHMEVVKCMPLYFFAAGHVNYGLCITFVPCPGMFH